MTSSQTFSILFWINNSRAKDGLAEIYARIVVNRQRANISLKTKVNPEHWDKSKGRLRTKDKDSIQVNGFIAQTRTQIFQCYMDLKASGTIFTAQSLKARFLGEDKDHTSMSELIAYHNEKMQPILHYDTMRHFKTSQNYIMEFIQKEYQSSDVFLKDLDYSFIIGFESFLRSYKPKHYQAKIGNNTIMKHIQRLRKMIRMAFHMEWMEKDPFIKFKPKLIKKERDFLTETEMERLENLSCSIPRLTNVKDLFLFSCFTGIAYGDIMLLTKKNIVEGEDGNLWIITSRKKTSTPVKVPLLPEALGIIEKYKKDYRTSITNTLLPVLSNQKINSYLKEIAYLCKIKKHLTFHMARHTFATTVTLTNGVPLETVSKLLGHTKLTTTQIYARVIEKKVSEDMNELKVKMQKKKLVG
ncbi:site-specific integrase [Salinimicrobium sediminilitoris]|uniref:site-specific integrase n=1 Tax=Salinimicrobium sediminilitoris TaxID=2876715 RepID=UPI001E3334FD|nr:site-specific integrase [Salinimicrobium sediminilitoris]MCC8358362.1 site-specific integrase [Salinimicrobium sediminilitoris]